MLAYADRFLYYTAAPQGNAVIPAKRDFQGQASHKLGAKADAPDVTVMAEMKRAIVRERETWPEAMQEQSRMLLTADGRDSVLARSLVLKRWMVCPLTPTCGGLDRARI